MSIPSPLTNSQELAKSTNSIIQSMQLDESYLSLNWVKEEHSEEAAATDTGPSRVKEPLVKQKSLCTNLWS
jgi:hypothetical protein